MKKIHLVVIIFNATRPRTFISTNNYNEGENVG